jgi:prolyl oligopeptidase
VPSLMESPPYSPIEAVTETLHGVSVTDPYRWLEDQESPRTREWLQVQTRYARSYLDSIPGRERIRERIRELLDIETYDSLLRAGSRYFFRKRLRGQEQPSIYMRKGADGKDELILSPSDRGAGDYTAVKPLQLSPDGRLLLYEVKEGGERTGSFALFDIGYRQALSDVLPRGYLRGFAFAPDSKSFYYVHEPLEAARPFYRAAYHHLLGTSFGEDREVFFAGESERIRLCLSSDRKRLGFLVYRFFENTRTDFYLKPFESQGLPERILSNLACSFEPTLTSDKVLAITNRDAPNSRIVELRIQKDREPEWIDVIPESDLPICGWIIVGNRIVVSYLRQTTTEVSIFDFAGKKTGEMPVRDDETVRLVGGSEECNEALIEAESFTEPVSVYRYCVSSGDRRLWAKRKVPFQSDQYIHKQVWYASKDGTGIPMFLMGRRDVVERGAHPTIMTSYGGHGLSMTPQFSVFVAFLVEKGCLFALPNIRGGSEFGVKWHNAAKRRNRQTAYDDFLCAAEWLINSGRTAPEKLAIFGGSNSGLLVGAALTQRPDLFRAVVCMAPILDMLRYHLFDGARIWRDEYGTADDPADFAALANYSPYHQVRRGVAYPATMIVSGDVDKNCNPLHARKMTAQLQAASASPRPVILDYSKFRGHSPVLPLSKRIDGLTDRMAFLCDQLELSA